jgi:hypothetical protein
MATWLTRQEKVNRFAWYLRWAVPGYEGFENAVGEGDKGDEEEDENEDGDYEDEDEDEDEEKWTTYTIAKKPSFPLTTISTITECYSASEFLSQLSNFVAANSTLTPPPIHLVNDKLLVPVYKQVVLQLPHIRELESESRRDPIHATPATEMSLTAKGMKEGIPSRFSTVLVRTAPVDEKKGPIHGKSSVLYQDNDHLTLNRSLRRSCPPSLLSPCNSRHLPSSPRICRMV